MNPNNNEEQGVATLSPSNSNGTIASTYAEIDFRGEAAQCLMRTTNYYAKAGASANNLYNKSISIIQSSGTGKSRTAEQLGEIVMTIPANLREEPGKGVKAYPPPDVVLREYFEDDYGKSDSRLRAEYAAVLEAMFDLTAAELVRLFKGLEGSELARKWAAHLRNGQSDEEVGENRKQFYQTVVDEAKAYIVEKSKKWIDRKSPNEKELEVVFADLLSSARAMVKCVAPKHSGEDNACYVYFDEAHNLTKQPKTTKTRLWSQYHNLGKVLAELCNQPIFFIFLSTNSHLQKFAPVARNCPSARASSGRFLVPPFTELPFDIFLSDMYEELEATGNPRSLANACTTKVMSSMGRALWSTHYWRWEGQWKKSETAGQVKKVVNVDDIFKLANDKLTLLGTKEHISDSELASLGIRVGITFNSMSPAAREVESRQVESHMRIVYSIPEHREYMRTGHSTEPILAEAAARFLHQTDMSTGIISSGPRILAQNIQQGFLAKGERGELCGRLLVTIAHDLAVGKCPEINTDNPLAVGPQPKFHRPVPVLDFLRALFAKKHHNTVLKATPVTRHGDGPTLETTFKEAFVCFSHFALADDSEVLEADCLQTCLFRGLAIQCKDNQYSVDAVIPIHMGPITNPITTETTSAIGLQFKNRVAPEPCSVNRSITIPDLEQPVISIVFELGEKSPKDPLVEAHHTFPPITRNKLSNPRPGPDDNHYSFVAHGCTHETYNAIPDREEARSHYRMILAADKLKYEFPRANNPMSFALYRAAKPTLSAAEVRKEWGQQPKGPKNPSIDQLGRSRASKQRKSDQPSVPGPSTLQRRISTRRQTQAGTQEEEPEWNGQKSGASSGPSLPIAKGVTPSGSGANMPNNQSGLVRSRASHDLAKLATSGRMEVCILVPAKRYRRMMSGDNSSLVGPSTEPKRQSTSSVPPAPVTGHQYSSQAEKSEPEDEEPDQKGKGTQTRGLRRKSRSSVGKGPSKKKPRH
ncbi:unnamed protein product [Rhizoctonia solani]|uniref:Uncharacterized protein n=1 Tax=Rhizoctonia solani TaxID=456999 RepID=A0A8H2WDS8_9AGAM|nr:unnamed protein product [Rhizoctonia solani]